VIWAKHLVERATPDGHDYLHKFGIRWMPLVAWVERGQTARGNSVPRFHLTWGTSRYLIARLIKALRGHKNAREKLALCFNHRVERIDIHNAKVYGLGGIVMGGEEFKCSADAVVVAAGGIGGDIGKIRKLWSPVEGIKLPPTILLGTHPGSDGRALDAAKSVGAKLTNMGRMWNYAGGIRHPCPQWADHGVSLIPPKSALWVDANGRRMMPPMVSGFDTLDLVQRVAAAPHGHTWQILNRRIALTELAASGADWNTALRDRRFIRLVLDMFVGNYALVNDLTANCPDVVTADTTTELVVKMNALKPKSKLDTQTLHDEIARFDLTLNTGIADEQRKQIDHLRGYRADRMRLAKDQRILDPKGGPLIAICEHIVTRKSLGGIVTDLRCRALDGNERPIPNLYAVGEAAGFGGGGSHGIRALEGTFSCCVITAQMRRSDRQRLKRAAGGFHCTFGWRRTAI
jgi:predicted oxidoreductase